MSRDAVVPKAQSFTGGSFEMAKILEVSQVSPMTDASSQSELRLPLTFSDTMWLRFAPVERLFFYSHPKPRETLLTSVVPKLTRSLSLALAHFLPLAGILTWPPDSPIPVVLYRPPDGSVSLTVAESDADIGYLCGDRPKEEAAFRGLVGELAVSESGASVMALQITIFPDKGFCIGVTSHHAVLDGKSTTMFVKSWAHLCRHDGDPPSLPPELTPFLDRSVVRDPEGLDLLYVKQWTELFGSKVSDPREDPTLFQFLYLSEIPPDAVRTTFNFSRADIAKLRRDVLSLSSVDGEELRLSSFIVSLAYMLFCALEATEERGDRVVAGFTADLRSRVKPPVPENYFGNFVAPASTRRDVMQAVRERKADCGSGGGGRRAFTAVAEILSEVVRRVERSEGMEAFETLTTLTSLAQSGRVIGVAGSPRFGVYGVDFGWGRPEKVEVVSIGPSGAVSTAESRDGSGGVEACVVMRKKEMEMFTSCFIHGLSSH